MGLLAPEVYQAQPNSVAGYVRHRPETTLLYQIIREYWPEFQAELARQEKGQDTHRSSIILQNSKSFCSTGEFPIRLDWLHATAQKTFGVILSATKITGGDWPPPFSRLEKLLCHDQGRKKL